MAISPSNLSCQPISDVYIPCKANKNLLLRLPVCDATGTGTGMNAYYAGRLTAYTNERNPNVLFTINSFNSSDGTLYIAPDNQGHYRGSNLAGLYIHADRIDVNIQASVLNVEPGYYSFDLVLINTMPIVPGSPATNSAFQAFATGTLDIQPSKP